ncbi:MAG: type VI secretion system baseplate subunit TssE, partial [Acidobacteriota bacterium]|nr:type VI secretion system baseplate subunit TssE [Acidobacteriota bacterium]
MAKKDIEGEVQISVLDRLIDEDPKRSSEAVPSESQSWQDEGQKTSVRKTLSRSQSLQKVKDSLRRDLEWLLNTRQTLDAAEYDGKDLLGTLFDYGLPDITSLSTGSSKDQTRLLRSIESAIAQFEPRLLSVKVNLQPVEGNTRVLHFMIEGMLNTDPAPEHVYFDTVLQVNTGEYEVKG